jgi:hypothetical protein
MKLKINQPNNYKLLMTMMRIKDALQKEAAIVDEAMNAIKTEFIIDGQSPKPGTLEYFELDRQAREYLISTEIEIPFKKIRLSDVGGISSLADLETLSGIIEINVDPE